MSVIIKVYCDDETRRIKLDEDVCTNFEYMKQKIESVFEIKNSSAIRIQWKDDEDFITISSDEELIDAIGNRTGEVLKLYIRTIKQKSKKALSGDIHQGIICDVCNRQICGDRYKCLLCPNYDLCALCYKDTDHQIDHCFVVFRSENVFIGKMIGHFISRLQHMQQWKDSHKNKGSCSSDNVDWATKKETCKAYKKYCKQMKNAEREQSSIQNNPHGSVIHDPRLFFPRMQQPIYGTNMYQPPPPPPPRPFCYMNSRFASPQNLSNHMGNFHTSNSIQLLHKEKIAASKESKNSSQETPLNVNNIKECRMDCGSPTDSELVICLDKEFDADTNNRETTNEHSPMNHGATHLACNELTSKVDDKEKLEQSLKIMTTMGFNNDSGWLELLLKEKNYDINQVLEVIDISRRRLQQTE